MVEKSLDHLITIAGTHRHQSNVAGQTPPGNVFAGTVI
jgi:hypothetical protein